MDLGKIEMAANKAKVSLTNSAFDHPLLRKLNDMTEQIGKTRLMVVYPNGSGWGQGCPGGNGGRPDFCKLIQSVPEGAKHCRMCHVLMTVAASSTGVTVQRCHAGVSVLVSPVPVRENEESMAVLSTCTFISPADKGTWLETCERGEKLGIPSGELRAAFDNLPVLDEKQCETIKELMSIASEAVKEIKTRVLLQKELIDSRYKTSVKSLVESAVEEKLKVFGDTASSQSSDCGDRERGEATPALVRVVADMIRSRPDIPYTVGEISAAARMTPNHFSMLFHQHSGYTFSEFLTEQRILSAKRLLGDFTLNISEVALQVGYDDPGYFSRRFRQITGSSPSEWRQRLQLADR